MLQKLIPTLLVVLFFTGCASSPDLQTNNYPEVLRGSGIVNVVVLEETSGDKALVQINGTNHDIDGVVFRTDKVERNTDVTAYQTRIDGRDRALLVKNQRWGGSYYTAYLPGGEEHHLRVDRDKSESFDKKDLLDTFKRQYRNNLQADLAVFDREGHVKTQKTRLKRQDDAATQACGSPVDTHVSWGDISDEKLMRLSIAGYCGVVAQQMEQQCRESEDFKPTASEIESVDCAFGETLALNRSGNTLSFTTARTAPNQPAFVLETLLGL